MAPIIRPPLLLSVLLVLVASAPLHAQRDVAGRRPVRADASDSTERQLRRLERLADSLARLFNDGDELSVEERRNIGDSLDRTVRRIQALAPRAHVVVRGMMAPAPDDRAAMVMGRAFVQAGSLKEALPRGWIGLVISGTALEPRIENGELFVRYLSHPEIVSVEPGSPAERAGITPSDTLIAYDGRDVSETEIAITRLLRPNARVLVRIRRGGRTKEVPVTIADVPSRISLRAETSMEVPAPPELPDATMFPRSPAPPARRGPPSAVRVPAFAPLPPMPPMAPMPAILPAPPTPALIFGLGYNSVAGAQLAAVTEGLARTIGVEQGVLVTFSPVGSLAYQAGLRDGDVIVQVAGAPIRTVAELRARVQAASANGDHTVQLAYVREKRTRKAVLRWSGAR